MKHSPTCASCLYVYIIGSRCIHSVFICLKFSGVRGLQGRLKGLRLEMGLLAVEVEGHPEGDCRTMIGGCRREGFGGLRWEDKGLDVWLGGWGGGESELRLLL